MGAQAITYGGRSVTEAPPDRIITAPERRLLVPYSDMHIWRLEKAGIFPRRIRLGPNRVGWSLREVGSADDRRWLLRRRHWVIHKRGRGHGTLLWDYWG